MRQFFRMLLLALVLMMVALVSALTAMRFAIHGREVAIPAVVGMTPAEAERAVAASGLEGVVGRQFYSPAIGEGRIISQAPPAGAKVRGGRGGGGGGTVGAARGGREARWRGGERR